MKKSLQVSLMTGFFIVAITIKANATERWLSDGFLQPFINSNTTIVKHDYGNVFAIDLLKNEDGSASFFGRTDVNPDPPFSQTVFGGSDPGFGDGGDETPPPDTPIDGGISLLIVLGISKGLKSFKTEEINPKRQILKRQLVSNLFQAYFGRFCSKAKIN